MDRRDLNTLRPSFTILTLGRSGQGITFDCPVCNCGCDGKRMTVWFRNPIDGGQPVVADALIGREGRKYEDLTIAGPVKGECGHTVDVTKGAVIFSPAPAPAPSPATEAT